MRLFGVLASAVLFLFFAFTAEAANSFPTKIIEKLSRHKDWISIPYTKIPVADSYQATPGIQKKWHFRIDPVLGAELIEKTQLTLTVDAQGKPAWMSDQVDLSEPIQLSKFTLGRDKRFEWKFKPVGKESFLMQTSGNEFHILFTPARPGNENAKIQRPLQNIHASTAPLGFRDESFRANGIIAKQTHYLHHDLSKAKEVWISPKFPKQHLATVKRSLQKWNKALQAELFQPALRVRDFDQDECFTSSVLCFIWHGPEQIPWTGMMALATTSFDPDNGQIIGGVIVVNNLAPANQMQATPQDIVTEALSNRADKTRWVAEQYVKQPEFVHLVHPFGGQSLEYFLLHEIGHFNGLQHNFAGSRHGNFENPTDSIMDYLPFSVNFKANQIGKFDLEMLDLIYRGKAPSQNYEYCDAKNFAAPFWVPGCDQRDFGDPLEWYKTLGELSPEGFLQPMTFVLPNFSQTTEPIIGVIAKYAESREADKARRIICDHLSSGVKEYLTSKRIDLKCP